MNQTSHRSIQRISPAAPILALAVCIAVAPAACRVEAPERSEAEEDAEMFARLQQLSSGDEEDADTSDEQPDVVFPDPVAEAPVEAEAEPVAADATSDPVAAADETGEDDQKG